MVDFTIEQVERIVEAPVGTSPEGMDDVRVTGRTVLGGIEIRGSVDFYMTTTVEVGGRTAEITTSMFLSCGFEIRDWDVVWK